MQTEVYVAAILDTGDYVSQSLEPNALTFFATSVASLKNQLAQLIREAQDLCEVENGPEPCPPTSDDLGEIERWFNENGLCYVATDIRQYQVPNKTSHTPQKPEKDRAHRR